MDDIWSSRKCRLSAPGNCLVANGRIHSLRSDGSKRGKNAYGYTDNKGILSISPIVPVMVLA